MFRGRLTILLAALMADEALRLSWPGAVSAPVLIAVLALLLALALLFDRALDWPPPSALTPLAVTAAIALCGLHPAFVRSVVSAPGPDLVACVAGLAAGIVICRSRPSPEWLRWAALLPVLPCILLHRAGISFALLSGAAVWLAPRTPSVPPRENTPPPAIPGAAPGLLPELVSLWPALLISALAAFLHRGEPFRLLDAIRSVPGLAAAFFAPFLSPRSADWTTVDGFAAVAAVVAGAAGAALVFAAPVVSFGLIWFLVTALLCPDQPVAALPGLALATVAALLGALAPVLPSRRDAASPIGPGPETEF